MYNEMGLLIDQGEVAKAINACDVFLVGFQNSTDRLIVDTRFNDNDGPMIEVTESTGSIEGRMFWLGQRRPQFGLPTAFKFFIWPNSIDWLESSGTWDRIRARLIGNGHDETVEAQLKLALQKVRAIEHAANLAAVRGQGYMTVWARSEAA